MTTINDGKYKPMDLGHALRLAGAEPRELGEFLEKTEKTIRNWMKKGQVPENLYPKIQAFRKRYTHHWMWRFDREPDTPSWLIEQVIELQREAETLESDARDRKLELVLTVLDAQAHPVTHEPLEHTQSETLLLEVLRARATYFHSALVEKGENLYLGLNSKACKVLDVIKTDGVAQGQFSRGYVRAAVEAQLGYVTMKAERREYTYEDERDDLRQMTRIIAAYKTDAGELVYPELFAKLRWNEANCHCAERNAQKFAADPIQDLIRLHGRRRILGLILRDKIVVTSLGVPDIAEFFGNGQAQAA